MLAFLTGLFAIIGVLMPVIVQQYDRRTQQRKAMQDAILAEDIAALDAALLRPPDQRM